jgi:L-asparaginase II
VSSCEIIASVKRGAGVESVHYGAAAVVNADGRLIASVGDPDFVTFSRSSLKPFQATPTVLRGAVERFGLLSRHVAVMCGSHNGEDRHVSAAHEILTAIGCYESDLNCGVHEPYIYRLRNLKPGPDVKFSQLHNNCSGKHSGMLTLCRLLDAPIAGYLEFDHPAQAVIREFVLRITGLPPDKITLGIDGCMAPNFSMPLRSLAFAYARLAAARGPDESSSKAMSTIVEAMRADPAMVSGEGRFDLALAETASDRLVSKAGGEAIECVALTDRGWGVAVKVADGGSRAAGVATTEVLRQLDVLSAADVDRLRPFAVPALKNHRRIITGYIHPALELRKHSG